VERSNAIDITSASAAQSTITSLDAALQTISAQRENLGATSNRLDSTVSNLTNISNNLTAGRGRIEDADFAAETTSLVITTKQLKIFDLLKKQKFLVFSLIIFMKYFRDLNFLDFVILINQIF
jgi:uncharacterized protein (UPF0333 family)